jgi:uncharacterized protein (DUF2235 family)
MKNIVICFDGTWNTSDAQFPTNVVKAAKLVLPADSRGADQVVFYDEGVGTTRVPFAQSINNAIAGAFGVGLLDNIERAYRFLSFNYSPGDNIFIFGFSRGAFSARSFGGLLRTCGILHKENIGRVKEAIALYQSRDREQGADAAPCVKFRNDYCFASYGAATLLDRVLPRSPQPLGIQYIGLWDTVGALGVPGFSHYFYRKYQFHDLDLSSMVKGARHALAIDERRLTFAATPWTNLAKLNEAAGQPSDSPAAPYQQLWFPGDHASVGGGGDVNGLWQAALVWVVEGARAAGLAINQDDLEAYRRDIDYKVSVNCMKKPMFSLASISIRRWRKGPEELPYVSDIARERVKEPAANLFERRPYRPRTLRAIIRRFRTELGIRLTASAFAAAAACPRPGAKRLARLTTPPSRALPVARQAACLAGMMPADCKRATGATTQGAYGHQ